MSDVRKRSRSAAADMRFPLKLGLGAIAGLYLLQLPSPLRLSADGLVMLSMAASALDGDGWRYLGESTRYPIGYPLLIYALGRTGLGFTQPMLAVNLALLFAGAWAGRRVLREAMHLPAGTSIAATVLTLVSFVVVQYSTMLHTEIPLLFTGLTAVLLLTRADTATEWRRRTVPLALAMLMIGVSLTLRTAALVLLAPLALVVYRALKARFAHRPRVPAAISTTVVAASSLALAVLIRESTYLRELSELVSRYGWGNVVLWNLRSKPLEWGALVLNVPWRHLPGPELLHLSAVSLAGTIGLIMVGRALVRRRWGPAEAYLAATILVFVLWPGREPRFWIPVLPLIFGLLLQSLPSWAGLRGARGAFVLWHLLAGAVAFAHTTRISYSGRDFADRWAYGDEYRAAVLGWQAVREPSRVHPEAYRLIRRFEPRSRGVRCQEPPDAAWTRIGVRRRYVCGDPTRGRQRPSR